MNAPTPGSDEDGNGGGSSSDNDDAAATTSSNDARGGYERGTVSVAEELPPNSCSQRQQSVMLPEEIVEKRLLSLGSDGRDGGDDGDDTTSHSPLQEQLQEQPAQHLLAEEIIEKVIAARTGGTATEGESAKADSQVDDDTDDSEEETDTAGSVVAAGRRRRRPLRQSLGVGSFAISPSNPDGTRRSGGNDGSSPAKSSLKSSTSRENDEDDDDDYDPTDSHNYDGDEEQNISPLSLIAGRSSGLVGDEDKLVVAREIGEDDDDKDDDDEEKNKHDISTMPHAVEYDPDAKWYSRGRYTRRGFRVLAFAVLTSVVLIVVGITVGVVFGLHDVSTSAPTSAPTTYRDTLGINDIVASVVGAEVLEDPDSPYAKALEWITNKDRMQLVPDVDGANHPLIVQRYIAAYFYYSTGPFKSCNPPQEGYSDDVEDSSSPVPWCYFSILYSVNRPFTYNNNTIAYPWLGVTPECRWAGIKCNEGDQITEIVLGKFRNSPSCASRSLPRWPFTQ